jgi:hypothetical protein
MTASRVGTISGETQPCSFTPGGGTTETDWTAKFGTPATTAWTQVTSLTSWRGS